MESIHLPHSPSLTGGKDKGGPRIAKALQPKPTVPTRGEAVEIIRLEIRNFAEFIHSGLPQSSNHHHDDNAHWLFTYLYIYLMGNAASHVKSDSGALFGLG